MTPLRTAVLVAALALSAGCGVSGTASAPPSTSAGASASATGDPAAGIADITCLQLAQAYGGAYDMATPPDEWVRSLLAALQHADGAQTTATGEAVTRYTGDLRTACADPAVSHESARTIGARVYGTAKLSYLSGR